MGSKFMNPRFIRAWIVAVGLLVLLFIYPPVEKQKVYDTKPENTEKVEDTNKSTGTVSDNSTITDDNHKIMAETKENQIEPWNICLLYTSPSPRDKRQSRMPSSA